MGASLSQISVKTNEIAGGADPSDPSITSPPSANKNKRYGRVSVHISSGLNEISIPPGRWWPSEGPQPHYIIEGCNSGLLHGGPNPIVKRAAKAIQSAGQIPILMPLYNTRTPALLIQHTNSDDLSGSWNVICKSSTFSRHASTFLVIGDKHMQSNPHELCLGNCVRLGSVGLVVTETGGGGNDAKKLNARQFDFLQEAALAFDEEHHAEIADIAEEILTQEGDGDDESEGESAVAEECSDQLESAADSFNSGTTVTLTADFWTNPIDTLSSLPSPGPLIPSAPTPPFSPDSCVKKEKHHKDYKGTIGTHRMGLGNGLTKFCYMCFEPSNTTTENPLVSACSCKGDTRYMHVECFRKWFQHARVLHHAQVVRSNGLGAPACKICGSAYKLSFLNKDGHKRNMLDAVTRCSPYIEMTVVTKHNNDPDLFHTKFRLYFAGDHADRTDTGGDYSRVVNNTIVIGRSGSCNMLLAHRTISTQHAQVEYRHGKFYLSDRGSSNGTHLYLHESYPLPWNTVTRLKCARTTITMKATRNIQSEWRYLLSKFGYQRALARDLVKHPQTLSHWSQVMNASGDSTDDSSSGADAIAPGKVGIAYAHPTADSAGSSDPASIAKESGSALFGAVHQGESKMDLQAVESMALPAANSSCPGSPSRKNIGRTYVGYCKPTHSAKGSMAPAAKKGDIADASVNPALGSVNAGGVLAANASLLN